MSLEVHYPGEHRVVNGLIETAGWAVFGGCDGDDPRLLAVAPSERLANQICAAFSPDMDGNVQVVPCFFTEHGGAVTLNHFQVNTHDELRAVLEADRRKRHG